MKFIIGCAIITLVFVVILRFTLRARVNAQEWKLQKCKNPVFKWLLFGVRRALSTVLFWLYVNLIAIIFVNVGLGWLAHHLQIRSFIKAMRSCSALTVVLSIVAIEPARHYINR
jgi:hypothetical protein